MSCNSIWIIAFEKNFFGGTVLRNITRRKKQMKDFEQVITMLKEYKERHGDCLVPFLYITEDGVYNTS